MLRCLALWLMLCLLIPAVQAAPAQGDAAPELRALLIGVDRFVTQPDTQPAAENNLRRLSAALSQDSRGYSAIHQSHNHLHSYEGFEQLVQAAFSQAKPTDISLLYISTHGLYSPGDDPMEFAMLLSDGQEEYALRARDLHRALSDIQGTKLLIIDTCNAGALIDRGMPGDGLRSLFTGKEYHVLTASGGSEPSFFWSTGLGNLRGGGYFADTLAYGISAMGGFAADLNRDGCVSLRELHGYLLRHYGVATPQVYPLEDDFPVLCYRKDSRPNGQAVVTNLMLEQSSFTHDNLALYFSFVLQRRARLAYQLVYRQQGEWQFRTAQVIADGELPSGESLPGLKEKLLELRPQGEQTSGYVLLMLTSVYEDSATPLAQALLSVEPMRGDPGLALSTPAHFAPSQGQELPIRIWHRFPLRMNVVIYNEDGEEVAQVAREQPSRPMSLPGGGSLLYWSGRLASGAFAEPGIYYAKVHTKLGGADYSAKGRRFRID